MLRWLPLALVFLGLVHCAQLIEPDIDSLDQDGDGIIDEIDLFPQDATEWNDLDQDGIGDNADDDDDGDGCLDSEDVFPENPLECLDTDNDDVGNNEDSDDDGDGILDDEDPQPLNPSTLIDTDGDGIDNAIDPDDDGDGVADADDAFPLDADESVDTDSDGIGNNEDTDDDGDGDPDSSDPQPLNASVFTDTDNDGITDARDSDDDGDGCADSADDHPLNSALCFDDDGDGVANANDAFPSDATESADSDSDGVGDNEDCNDSNANISTKHHELCDNSTDDNCDGSIDEIGCVLLITGGTFTMGADTDDDGEQGIGSDSSVAHSVTLSNFYVDKYEVTNALYGACVDAGDCTEPDSLNAFFGNATYNKRPVIFVSWDQASAYCSFAGKRLPTEAEYEYLASNASGTDGNNTYPWGNAAPSTTLANFFPGSNLIPQDVDQFVAGANENGVFNLAGNATEWVFDYAGDYSATAVTNPTGPAANQETSKIVRGGSFASSTGTFEATDRAEDDQDDQTATTGFRCASSTATIN